MLWQRSVVHFLTLGSGDSESCVFRQRYSMEAGCFSPCDVRSWNLLGWKLVIAAHTLCRRVSLTTMLRQIKAESENCERGLRIILWAARSSKADCPLQCYAKPSKGESGRWPLSLARINCRGGESSTMQRRQIKAESSNLQRKRLHS